MAKLRAAILFLAVAATARGEWSSVSAESEPGHDGIVHRHLVFENGAIAKRADVDLAIFSAKVCTLRVIDNADGSSDLAEAMHRSQALAGVNGGYFDPDFAPIGLRIMDGETIRPLIRARLMTGVLCASGRGVQIVRIAEFSRNQKISAALQCGPFLVDHGKAVRGLDDSRSARRTFAATFTGDQIALGVCSEVSLAELARILSTIRLPNDSRILRALNLDGGSSSAFWFARENGAAFSIPERKPVRDFVAIVTK